MKFFIFCLAGSCPSKFRHWQTYPDATIMNNKQCFAVTKDLIQSPNPNGGRAGCKKYDANSELMEDHGQAWCEQSFINHIRVYLLHTFHHVILKCSISPVPQQVLLDLILD